MAKMKFTPKRKLSSKDILGIDTRALWKVAVKKDENLQRIDVYTIGGRVNRYDEVSSPFGESLRLIGDFIAVNTCEATSTKGEIFRSNRAFLPAIMTDTIVSKLSTMAAKDSAVEFGFKVAIVADEKSQTGYVFTFEEMIEAEESNAMLNIAEKIGAKSAMEPMVASVTVTEPVKQGAKGK